MRVTNNYQLKSELDTLHSCLENSRLLVKHGAYVPTEIGVLLGKAEAMFLQDIHYWMTCKNNSIGIIKEGRRWIYNTYEQWAKNIRIYSARTIRRAAKKLEKLGILISATFRRGDATKAYAIDYDALDKFVLSNKKKSDSTKRHTINHEALENIGSELQINDRETPSNPQNYSCGQNGRINIQKHTKIQVLNTRESCFQKFKKVTKISPTVITQAEEAIKKIEAEILPKLSASVSIDKAKFYWAYVKALRGWAGTHETFMQWIEASAKNMLVMGQKAMKSGDRFKWGIGTLFSGKLFDQFWEKKGIFDVWPPKEEDMPRKKENKPLPSLTRESVLAAAKSDLDRCVKAYLLDNLPTTTYLSWFHNNSFAVTGTRNGKIEFAAQCGEFTRNQIMDRFQDQLEKAFNQTITSFSIPYVISSPL